MKFANKIVVSAVCAIMVYTAASFLVLYKTGNLIPDALTYSYFSFWAIEMISLAGIKKTKTKTNYMQDFPTNLDESLNDDQVE